MLNFIARRTAYAIVTLLLVSMAIYAIFAILPFDPAALSCGKGYPTSTPGLVRQ